jgi:hypothetical protein
MDPRKLIHLAAIIEQGGFKQASRQLGVSQPALVDVDRAAGAQPGGAPAQPDTPGRHADAIWVS